MGIVAPQPPPAPRAWRLEQRRRELLERLAEPEALMALELHRLQGELAAVDDAIAGRPSRPEPPRGQGEPAARLVTCEYCARVGRLELGQCDGCGAPLRMPKTARVYHSSVASYSIGGGGGGGNHAASVGGGGGGGGFGKVVVVYE